MELYTSQAAMADHNGRPEFARFVEQASLGAPLLVLAALAAAAVEKHAVVLLPCRFAAAAGRLARAHQLTWFPSHQLATCCRLCPQAQEHLEGSIGMVLYEYNNGKIGPAGMEVCRQGGVATMNMVERLLTWECWSAWLCSLRLHVLSAVVRTADWLPAAFFT